ncbi:uncharacterized protein BXIN_1481 [Babesia sp. Xinjiang]|uniref:uncharacterized protein n=1 Tax=Babesia sp. Xinjiang TaxID=462227 RepID=UPI000A247311|nr:uncharacterized protein BXIN_1481 [Babesia sp. Xinjiang]ORM40177.1 hypothetical protein BXIN_1481 [Babesia sp. Xinjiang]
MVSYKSMNTCSTLRYLLTDIFLGACDIVVLQHKCGFCLFDMSRRELFGDVTIDYSNFSRIGLCLEAQRDRITVSASASIELSAPSDDVGTLQNIEPLPFISDHHFASTYECGLVSVFDLRKTRAPVLSYRLKDVEATPSLAAWRSVLLVGDTCGNVYMLHVSASDGIILLKRANIYSDVAKQSGIGCLEVRSDGAITVAGCWDYSLRVLETRSLEVKAVLCEHNDSIMDISFDISTGDFATCAVDGNGHVWKLFSSNYKRV